MMYLDLTPGSLTSLKENTVNKLVKENTGTMMEMLNEMFKKE